MRRTIAAATVALLVAGCSSGGLAGSAGRRGKGEQRESAAAGPCAVLSNEQIAKALGGKAPSSHHEASSGCTWKFDDEAFALQVYTGPADYFASRLSEADKELVPNVGERAGWTRDAGVLFGVSSGKGLQIVLATSEPKRTKRAAIALARDIFTAIGVPAG